MRTKSHRVSKRVRLVSFSGLVLVGSLLILGEISHAPDLGAANANKIAFDRQPSQILPTPPQMSDRAFTVTK